MHKTDFPCGGKKKKKYCLSIEKGKDLVFCSSELLHVKPHEKDIYLLVAFEFLTKLTKKSLYVVTQKYYLTKLAVDFLQIATCIGAVG